MLRFTLLALVACSPHHTTSPDGNSDAPPDTPVDAPSSGTTPMLVTSFAGESGAAGTRNCGRSGGANCAYKDHPDAAIAANGTYVVEATGQSISVYDPMGSLLKKTDVATFIAQAGGAAGIVNDPFVDWNEFAQRWIVAIPTSAQDLVIVSATADPRGGWSGKPLTLTNKGDVTIKLAHDSNGEYLGEYPSDGGGVADPNTAGFSWYCFAIPTAEVMWSGSYAPAHTNQHPCAYEARPVMDHTPNKPGTAPFYYVGKTCPAGSCQNATNFAFGLIVHRGTWNGAAIMLDSKGAGGMDRIVPTGLVYNTPVMASQGSGPAVAAAESHRVFAAELRGSTIHAVLGSGAAHDVLDYAAVDVATYPTLVLAGATELSDPARDFLYPGLALDAAGNVAITALCTGAAQRMSLCAWSATSSTPTVLFAGTQAYQCNGGAQVGTGTYANAVFDGTSLWAVEQDGESAQSCTWTTRIAQFALR